MVALLFEAKRAQKAAGGKPNTLSVEDQLFMMLAYWREYRAYFHIGQSYGLGESAAYRNIKWCENTLTKSKAFRLPGRKAVAAGERAFDIVLIDATETPIERPKKQRRYYFGQEEAAHAENATHRRKIDTPHSMPRACKKKGRHDFRLFKISKVHLHPETKAVADSGYQGLQRKARQHSDAQKAQQKESVIRKRQEKNRAISSERVPCENVIAMLKRFKILADRYRNRRRRFGLRFFLIAAIYNMELGAT